MSEEPHGVQDSGASEADSPSGVLSRRRSRDRDRVGGRYRTRKRDRTHSREGERSGDRARSSYRAHSRERFLRRSSSRRFSVDSRGRHGDDRRGEEAWRLQGASRFGARKLESSLCRIPSRVMTILACVHQTSTHPVAARLLRRGENVVELVRDAPNWQYWEQGTPVAKGLPQGLEIRLVRRVFEWICAR